MSGLRERAYTHICRKLAEGELPPGSRLSNRSLAKEIGVSLIPVREAISQLVSDGLGEHRPGLGVFVKELSMTELRDLYDLREALECHAVRRARDRLAEGELRDMQSCNDQMKQVILEVEQSGAAERSAAQIDRWLTADATFHLIILRASGNARILKIVGDLRLMSRIFSHRLPTVSLDALWRTHADHERVLEALQIRDADAACAAMTRHILYGCGVVLAALQAGGESRELAAIRELEGRLGNL